MADQQDVVTKIINCVRQYPALYDTTHEDYNRYYKKIQIWNLIAAEVNYSDGKVAQTKWRNIRDSYVKHLKSLQCAEPAYKKYRNWAWVEQMSFLRKFLGGNKHKHAKDDMQETSLIEAVESVYGEQINFGSEAAADNLENVIASTVAPKTNRNDSPTMWFTPEIVESTAADCDNSYPKDYFMDYPTSNQIDRGGGAISTGILSGNGFVHDHDKDATDLLFLSYSKTLKSFSKKRQVQIKMKISQIMGQAELDDEDERTGESNHVDSSENNHDRGKVKITHVGKKFKYS